MERMSRRRRDQVIDALCLLVLFAGFTLAVLFLILGVVLA